MQFFGFQIQLEDAELKKLFCGVHDSHLRLVKPCAPDYNPFYLMTNHVSFGHLNDQTPVRQ